MAQSLISKKVLSQVVVASCELERTQPHPDEPELKPSDFAAEFCGDAVPESLRLLQTLV